MRVRQRLTSLAVALAALMFLAALVLWSGVVSRSACLGLIHLVEATPNSLVVRDYTIQAGWRGLWIGERRVSVVSLFNVKDFR